jgi:hypothetical protein
MHTYTHTYTHTHTYTRTHTHTHTHTHTEKDRLYKAPKNKFLYKHIIVYQFRQTHLLSGT